MIDCGDFRKIYEKVIITENHNLTIEKIAQVTGASGDRVAEKASELGFRDLSHLSPQDFDKIVQALMTEDKDMKAPIKDEDNLGDDQSKLTEADPVDETDPDAETENKDNAAPDLKFLYNVVSMYHQALVKNNAKATELINVMKDNPLVTRLEKKYSQVSIKADTFFKQDEGKANLPNLNTMMTQLFRTIVKNNKEAVKNP